MAAVSSKSVSDNSVGRPIDASALFHFVMIKPSH
jgi:hypothetical protein